MPLVAIELVGNFININVATINIFMPLSFVCIQMISLGPIPQVKPLGQRHAHFSLFFLGGASHFILCCLYIFPFFFFSRGNGIS